MTLARFVVGAPLRLAGGAFLAATVGAASAFPQEPTRSFSAHTEVSSILIPVTITDKKGRPVPTLERAKFHLLVDGIEFPIREFWREGGLPLSLAFVLDTSGSMGGRRLSRAREAILEFVRQLRPDDEVCLITFGAGEVKRRLKFGTDPGLLPRILESLRGYGTTALYDVLAATPQIMEGTHNIRRAILLFTDGVDTASQLTADDAIKVLEGLNDPLYTFGIEPPPASEDPADSYEDLLRRFSLASGGKYLRVGDVAKLPQVARELRGELTMRYIIALQPSGLGTAKWRTVQVRVEGPYLVQARHGYRGTLP